MKTAMTAFLLLIFATTSNAIETNQDALWFLNNKVIRKTHRIAKKLEIENYFVNTDRKDVCAVEQLNKLIHDYRGEPRAQKQDLKSVFRKINILTVAPSVSTGSIEGELYVIYWTNCHMQCSGRTGSKRCHQSCVTNHKVIGQQTTYNGSKPVTGVVHEPADAKLTLGSQFMKDNVIRKRWDARDGHTYRRITSRFSPEFEHALADGYLEALDDRKSDEPICGTVSLARVAEVVR